MSVLIKGMEMPTSCAVCPFEIFGDCYGGKVKAIMDVDDYNGERHPNCPLVPVPAHGRLIDADAVAKMVLDSVNQEDAQGFMFTKIVCKILEEALTIIEAEGEA